MEYGYLWLALSLFTFLMTTGASIANVALAYPLLRRAEKARFGEFLRLYRRREMLSYGLLSLMAAASTILLLANAPYQLRPSTMLWMGVVIAIATLLAVGSWFTARRLARSGRDEGLLRRVGVLLRLAAATWLVGSGVVVRALLEVVGLV